MKKKNRLINAQPTIKHLNDGRQIDLVTKEVLRRRSSSCIYEIIKPTGEVSLAPNLLESVKILATKFNNLKKHLAKLEYYSEGVVLKDHKVRRIPVFYPKS